MIDPNIGKLTSMHFYGWKKGLKTGMYYLRTKAATDAIKFTVDQEALDKDAELKKLKKQKESGLEANVQRDQGGRLRHVRGIEGDGLWAVGGWTGDCDWKEGGWRNRIEK